MSRHLQSESTSSLTGPNADQRIPARLRRQRTVLNALNAMIGGGGTTSDLRPAIMQAVESGAAQVRRSGSSAVVVSGIPDAQAQAQVLSINEALGSQVMDSGNPRMVRQGNSSQVQQLIADMNAGSVGAIMIAGVNPAYSLPNANEFVEGLKNVELSIAFSMKADETAKLCKFIAATPHYLESWGDVQLTRRNFTLMQPTIRPLFDTRQFQDTLLRWMDSDVNYYDYIRETWQDSLGTLSWSQALHDGFFESDAPSTGSATTGSTTAQNAATALTGATATASTITGNAASGNVRTNNNTTTSSPLVLEEGGFELELYTSVGMGDGQQANNPWLQEFPDPVTRVSWDNYLKVSRADAEELGLTNEHASDGGLNGSYVNLSVGDRVLEKVPVYIQPGQARGTVSLALGYGKKEGVQEEMQVGVNAYSLYRDFRSHQNVRIEKVGGTHEFACVQLHRTLMGRGDIIKETTLEIFNTQDVHVWNKIPEVSLNHIETPVTSPDVDLWNGFDRSIGHHFNMSID